MPDGYCFEFELTGDWTGSADDYWNIEVYKPTGQEKQVGSRFIDGSRCCVFSCPDGKFRAVNAVSVG